MFRLARRADVTRSTRTGLKFPAPGPADPELEWCPPGHGDIYTALTASGTLDALLGAGLRYAFVSNSDNLGALADVRMAAWLARLSRPQMGTCGQAHARWRFIRPPADFT